MPRGASPKREREYEELKEEFKDEGRYKGREEEVAARIVNKQRAEHGETRQAHEKHAEGKAEDRDLPIDHYDDLTVDAVEKHLDPCSTAQMRQIRAYEQQHQNRKALLEALDRRLKQP